MERASLRKYGPLLLLIAVELAWSVYLAATRTIPRGHDGFQYFYLKYYFFNDFVQNGEVAQWMPYLTHGSPAAWWYIVQSGMFDLPAFALARVFRIGDFISVFYTLLWLEKALLVVGTWLLASEHMNSRVARFVVVASVSLTTIWHTGVWWNFHAFLALPMMLFLLHRAIHEFRWSWLAGLSLLLFLQMFGQLSYYLPMTLLFLTSYAALNLAPAEVRAGLRDRMRFSAAGIAAVVAINAAFLFELLWLRRASREIAFPASQRGTDGSVSLEMFLTHGGNMDLRPLNEFFSGLTPRLDATQFAGFLIAALTIAAIAMGRLSRAQRLFGWLTLIAILISTSSPLSVFVYYFWPLGNLFRHLTLVLPIAKLFGVFLAGATLDRLVREEPDRTRTKGLIAVTIVCAGWIVLLTWFGIDAIARRAFIRSLVVSSLPAVDDYTNLLSPGFVLRGAAFATLSWLVLVPLLRGSSSTRARRERLAWAAAAVLLLDAVTYNAQEIRTRMLTLSEREAAIFMATDLPYAEQRSETTDDVTAPRHYTFSKTAGRLIGTRYWAESLLWLTDGYRTSGFTVLWSNAFESLLGALRNRPGLGRLGTEESLPLPLDDDLVTSIGGYRESKVRFFNLAMACPDVESTGQILASPSYLGQLALVTLAPPSLAALAAPRSVPCDAGSLPQSAESTGPEPSATNSGFTSNRAEFNIENPTGRPLVMTYSDSWSEHWRAQINDTPAPVLRSDLAYKAIIVPAGRSHVVFEYKDDMGAMVFALQGAAGIGLVLWLPLMLRRRTTIEAE